MLSKYSPMLAAIVLLGMATSLPAQENNWYGAFGAGASFTNDIDYSEPGLSLSTGFDTGFLVTGAVGRFFNRFRGEVELNYIQSDVDTISATLGGASGSVSGDGDVSSTSLMVNGYYEFDTGSPWSPFVGGGLGGANVSVNDVGANGTTIIDDDDTVLAYQIKVGVAYRFQADIEGTVGYRYFATDELDLSTGGASFSIDGPETHNFEVGIRFRF